jgi:hypothetical protein
MWRRWTAAKQSCLSNEMPVRPQMMSAATTAGRNDNPT